ncbi:hypothetical protein [Catellatospora chokoriensis]|uniref:Uncharacterized protein n=1 Tax=Catellatospora chokoriensis TaxID=310353 RepID=A0A8J3NSV8_9ACTN|nr:hypothetical protein [Catellatospora chokoriensis]GIF91392.1 hypothetical protein Cch02nite_48360 [Catellatospora chokoriensis]
MSLTDAEITAALAPAGLQFIERVRQSVQLPLPAGRGAASCASEDGRFDCLPHEIVDVNDPDLSPRVNAGWWRMATEFGLLDEQREFLLAVDPEIAWVRVRLLDEWDIAGSGVPALRSSFAGLFTDRFVPEFTTVSLDGRMLMNTTVWGDGTVSTIVIRPDRLPSGGPSTGHQSV